MQFMCLCSCRSILCTLDCYLIALACLICPVIAKATFAPPAVKRVRYRMHASRRQVA